MCIQLYRDEDNFIRMSTGECRITISHWGRGIRLEDEADQRWLERAEKKDVFESLSVTHEYSHRRNGNLFVRGYFSHLAISAFTTNPEFVLVRTLGGSVIRLEVHNERFDPAIVGEAQGLGIWFEPELVQVIDTAALSEELTQKVGVECVVDLDSQGKLVLTQTKAYNPFTITAIKQWLILQNQKISKGGDNG